MTAAVATANVASGVLRPSTLVVLATSGCETAETMPFADPSRLSTARPANSATACRRLRCGRPLRQPPDRLVDPLAALLQAEHVDVDRPERERAALEQLRQVAGDDLRQLRGDREVRVRDARVDDRFHVARLDGIGAVDEHLDLRGRPAEEVDRGAEPVVDVVRQDHGGEHVAVLDELRRLGARRHRDRVEVLRQRVADRGRVDRAPGEGRDGHVARDVVDDRDLRLLGRARERQADQQRDERRVEDQREDEQARARQDPQVLAHEPEHQ